MTKPSLSRKLLTLLHRPHNGFTRNILFPNITDIGISKIDNTVDSNINFG